jgi:putative transposase
MRRYLRLRRPGSSYFFTLNLEQRQDNRLFVERIDDLRHAFEFVKRAHPFELDAIVVLPEHLHAIWTLPTEDADFSTRWSLIKARFSRAIATGEQVSASRSRRRERGIWQHRFYEHMIRDEKDFEAHLDYVHWNPIKHGLTERAAEWPYSSFHRYVRMGLRPLDWANKPSETA